MNPPYIAAHDWLVACTIATEVPPVGIGAFTPEMIPAALRAVADVIRNRVAAGSWGHSPVEVVLAKNQFSAVCREDYWRKAVAGLWQLSHVLKALAVWQTPQCPDNVGGATYYYSPVSMRPVGAIPSWVAGLTEVVVPGIDPQFFRFYK